MAKRTRDDFLTWGRAPHNPHEGHHRPAFNQAAYARYQRGEVDANGDPTPEHDMERPGPLPPKRTKAPLA